MVGRCYHLTSITIFRIIFVFFFSVLHEKIFIVFMAASLLHMYCRAKVGCVALDEVEPVRSNKLVWTLFFVSVFATVGLIVFFLRHRLLCRPLGKNIRPLFFILDLFSLRPNKTHENGWRDAAHISTNYILFC